MYSFAVVLWEIVNAYVMGEYQRPYLKQANMETFSLLYNIITLRETVAAMHVCAHVSQKSDVG